MKGKRIGATVGRRRQLVVSAGTVALPDDKGENMSNQERSRRSFLVDSVSGLGGVWVLTNYPGILAAEEFVRAEADSGQPAEWAFFTEEQAIEVEEMSAQIIPTDHTPGAREARVVRFIDRILVTFDRDRQDDYTQGLQNLSMVTKDHFPSVDKFSGLIFDQQLEVLMAIESTPFFNLVRTHTITGFFASPRHGGNAGKVGWDLLGYDDSLNHEAPFGYYDALPLPRRDGRTTP
jgi:gluconate 2-dehydrogenase gamma chain